MAPDDDLFQPAKPVRAHQRVAQQIEERSLSGDLPPGARWSANSPRAPTWAAPRPARPRAYSRLRA
ncbi:hypothetical protein ACWFRM_25155 [Streptomyces sp. NPDC055144]